MGSGDERRSVSDGPMPAAGLDPEELDSGDDPGAADVLAIDDALHRLAALDPQQERIVELRFFAGLTVEETAHVLGRSARTIKREWQLAKAWLFRELQAR